MSPQTSLQLTHLLNTKCTSLSSLKQIHSLLITHGLFPFHLQISAKLLSLSSSLSSSISYTHQIFDEIPQRDSFLYNTLFRAYSNHGPLKLIFPLYSQMHRFNLSPDQFTFPSVLRSSAVLLKLREGRQAHCNVIKNGLDCNNVFVSTSLVVLYSNCSEIVDMELVFRGVEVRNVEFWTSMVAGYVQNSIFLKGVEFFHKMVRDSVRPNEVTIVSVLPAFNGKMWLDSGRSVHGFAIKEGFDSFTSLTNALISMYGKCGDLKVARFLFDGMSHKTIVSWNSIIAVYEQNGEAMKAIELFRTMIKSINFNAITLVSVISACASLGALDIGKWAHNLAISQNLNTDARIGNALINMYSKCGNLTLAFNAFQKIQQKSVVSWTAMINADATHGHVQNALKLFDEMITNGTKPNSFTFTAVLTSCSRSGLLNEGLKHFESMRKDYGILPKFEHCTCLVDLLGRAGRLREAYQFVKGMEIKPDTGVWGALLGGCRIHGDLELAESVVEEILKVEEFNVTLCVVMANIYADAGKWKDAARMRRLMKKKELRKIAGLSSVER